jgi:hypothetical protein
MNLDLLTLLENIVSGFVSFFYSLLRSLFETARRPVRGPLRLYRRYKNPKSRQIGGVTFLCMGFFLIFYIAFNANDITPRALLAAALKAIQKLPDTHIKDFWPILVGSLASTIIVDAALRFLLDIFKLRRRRRDLVLASTEYALFWAALFAVVVATVLWVTFVFGSRIDPTLYLIAAFGLVLCAPAATILNSGTRAGRGIRARTRIGRWLAILALLAMLMFTAALAGYFMWAAVRFDEAKAAEAEAMLQR